jgi:L-cysteate sulfo-lyase|tara:strand:- start:5041 stop:6063 length:1023 start_codon:yes stop_codon:yes gene_type:complete
MQLSKYPRVKLIHSPTPLEYLDNLTKHFGGPKIYIKRDDCTGLAFGGNKSRKLEFLMGDAIANKSDVVITAGAVQSNHCRQTAAAATKLGMECIIVAKPSWSKDYNGNLFLDELLGAKLVLIEDDNEALDQGGKLSMEETIDKLMTDLKNEGKSPYYIPVGGSNSIGSLGYISMTMELVSQANEMDIEIGSMVAASGSGGTQTGMILGADVEKSGIQAVGMGISSDASVVIPKLTDLCNQTSKYYDLGLNYEEKDIIFNDNYIGEGYGIPSEEMIEAVKLLARKEGIILDPVYSGKAFAGMVDLIKKGYFDKSKAVVFIHTGGTPALFVYSESFREYLQA